MNSYPNYSGLSNTSVEADIPLTDKGDLVTRDTSANIRLPVGADGLVLTANSAEASGLEWSATAGTGDVIGPAGIATSGTVPLYSGTTGKLISDSTIPLKKVATNSLVLGLAPSLTGTANTLIGDLATGYALTSGTSNVAVGNDSGTSCITGSENVSMGASSLRGNLLNSCTAVGFQSQVTNSGNDNTTFGHNSGISTTGATNCTFIGSQSTGAATASNSSAFGYASVSDKNNQIMMGDANITELVPNASATVSLGSATNTFASAYLEDITAPANPGAGKGVLYKLSADDGLWWKPDAAGTAVDLTAASGTGDVLGGATSVDNEVVVYNGTGGKTIKSSGGLLYTDLVDKTSVQAISGIKTHTNAIMTDSTNVVYANGLRNLTTVVSTDTTAAPTTGQALIALNDSNADWVTLDNTNVGLDNVQNTKVNLVATTAPAVSNDNTEGYTVGSTWVDVTNDKAYIALDVTTGAAVWTETTQAGGGSLPTTALGDLIVGSSTAGVGTALTIGSTGQVLTVAGGTATWAAAAGGGGSGSYLTTYTGITTTSGTLTSTTQTIFYDPIGGVATPDADYNFSSADWAIDYATGIFTYTGTEKAHIFMFRFQAASGTPNSRLSLNMRIGTTNPPTVSAGNHQVGIYTDAGAIVTGTYQNTRLLPDSTVTPYYVMFEGYVSTGIADSQRQSQLTIHSL